MMTNSTSKLNDLVKKFGLEGGGGDFKLSDSPNTKKLNEFLTKVTATADPTKVTPPSTVMSPPTETDKQPLPPRNIRVYIHEGKPAPKGAKIYDAGDFKGGHEGVQFWLATDSAADDALPENHRHHKFTDEELSDPRSEANFIASPKNPHTIMVTNSGTVKEKPWQQNFGGKIGGSGFTAIAQASKAEAIKEWHDNIHPLRPDETLASLVQEGKVDLPDPTDFRDGIAVGREDGKSTLAKAILDTGEDYVTKSTFYEADFVKDRFDDDTAVKFLSEEEASKWKRPDTFPDADVMGHFPLEITSDKWGPSRTIGQNMKGGQKVYNKAAKQIYKLGQESLDRRGLPDEFIVYRGNKDSDRGNLPEMNEVLSVSLLPHKAEWFASDEGKRELGYSATLMRAYKVKKADILADISAMANNKMGEAELLIDAHTLEQRHVKTAKLPDFVWRPMAMKMIKFIRAEVDMEKSVEKSWYTNPRGSRDAKRKNTIVRKEGDGGGGFGDGGGTAFTSADAGIFTPTFSERSKQPKKKKKESGIERLDDFINDNSPERKMEKGDTTITTLTDLINWVKMEMRKEKRFRQQTSGETINNQPPRIDWARGNKELEHEDNPVEFDAEPDEQAATSQKDEERRIRRLQENEDKKDNEPQGTGTASMAAPAGLNISLSEWESGPSSDELMGGSDKDKEHGELQDPDDEHEDEDFLEELIKDLDS